jgi:mersacidin/lichenicidin family type 2 lantibiotic
MQEIDKIIRAWKDDDYRMSLSDEEQRALPAHPVGYVEPSRRGGNEPAGIFRTIATFVVEGFGFCCL